MNITKQCFIVLSIAAACCACEDSATKKAMSFPGWPQEEVYTYDTVDCTGLDIPAEAITVKKALEIGKTLANKQTTDQKYYIKGLVKGFNNSEKYNHEKQMQSKGQAYVYIQDNVKTNKEFYGYLVQSIDNKAFKSLDELKVGDFVVIYSSIYNFNGTIETGGSPYLTYTSNPLAYPEKDVIYFEDGFANWPGLWVQNVISSDDPTVTVWTGKTSSGVSSAVAQAKTADNKNFASEVALVSPAVNLAKNNPKSVKLSFETKHSANIIDVAQYLRLFVSRDGSHWDEMAFEHGSGGSFASPKKDTVDISAYVSANTYIKFVYKSTNDYATKWTINNIHMFERKRGK